MKYEHRFRVNAPVTAVADFYAQTSSLIRISPPPVVIRFHQAPEIARSGDQLSFTMWIGPISVRWLSYIEEASRHGFVDSQLSGPFRHWRHRHRFVPVDDVTTDVLDEVEAGLRVNPIWGPIGGLLWLTLPILFVYRAFRTRQILRGVGS